MFEECVSVSKPYAIVYGNHQRFATIEEARLHAAKMFNNRSINDNQAYVVVVNEVVEPAEVPLKVRKAVHAANDN